MQTSIDRLCGIADKVDGNVYNTPSSNEQQLFQGGLHTVISWITITLCATSFYALKKEGSKG